MSDIVRDYYNTHAQQEHGRLDHAVCRIELASTLRLIDKYFPQGGRVCDIGGATGRYTAELLRRGYAVTLLDLSEAELRLAQEQLQSNGLAAEQIIAGDARDLRGLASGSFDAALLMGPMYHILERTERAKALAELRRVLKPRGVAIIAFLNGWGVLRTGIADGPEWFKDLALVRSLLDGRAFAANSLSEFTECYCSTPVLALQEVQEAGFEIVSRAGAESFASGMGSTLEQVMRDLPEAYSNIVTLAAETSELEQYRDITDHLHVVARKKDSQ